MPVSPVPLAPPPPFVHIQRSGVSVTLPGSPDTWAAWDARFLAAKDVTPQDRRPR